MTSLRILFAMALSILSSDLVELADKGFDFPDIALGRLEDKARFVGSDCCLLILF
jgi:hypothetical protein